MYECHTAKPKKYCRLLQSLLWALVTVTFSFLYECLKEGISFINCSDIQISCISCQVHSMNIIFLNKKHEMFIFIFFFFQWQGQTGKFYFERKKKDEYMKELQKELYDVYDILST